MLKTDALVMLVNSLSKAEKRAFKTNAKASDYMDLFNLIDKNKNITGAELRDEFSIKKKKTNFDVTVAYLYKLLLDCLLALREENDSHYLLMNKLLKARVLFEKSLFEESLDLLHQVMEAAKKKENFSIYLSAARFELEYLMFLNFPGISETELLAKHFRLNETLKVIRKINEQSSLYELLKYRIIHNGNIRSKKQKDQLNDLLISEMSIMASSKENNFEIKKLHQLFQSNYLISVGDYKSALHSYYELNNLFESNKHLLSNPPSYYLTVLEGILDSLRSIKNYSSMDYFIQQLEKLQHPTVGFQMEVSSIIFLYSLYPFLDKGQFQEAKAVLQKNESDFLNKTHLLNPTRQAEISLYNALVYFGLRDYKLARKCLLPMISHGKRFQLLPLYRTIRLVNLMIDYETNDFDTIKYETLSIRREITKIEKAYQVERLMLMFLNKRKSDFLLGKREKMWRKLEPELQGFREDVFEMQILKLFDFTAWVESKLTQRSLPEVLEGRESCLKRD